MEYFANANLYLLLVLGILTAVVIKNYKTKVQL